MITAILGMPGDGKSLFGVSLPIANALVNTEVHVVTNIRMKLPDLHEVVSKEREAKWKRFQQDPWDWDVDKRVKVISDGDAFEFFRFRSGGLQLDHSPDYLLRELEEREQNGKRMDKRKHDERMLELFEPMTRDAAFKMPVHYHIDEAHDIFPSREWTMGGRGVLYYASKHRHLWDEIYLYTQQFDQVEKQLRNLVSETVVVRNQIRRNIGPVKCRPCFTTRWYYGQYTPTAKPFQTPKMFLETDKWARCYKTTGAMGIHHSPEQIKNKGWLPWWTLPVGGLLAVAMVVVGFVALPGIGAYMGKKFVTGSQAAMGSAMGTSAPAPAVAGPAARAIDKVGPEPFREAIRAVDDARKAAAEVKAVMTVGDGVLVLVPGYEWSRIHAALPHGLVELVNGQVVRREDILRPQKPGKVAPETEKRGQQRSEGRLAAQ